MSSKPSKLGLRGLGRGPQAGAPAPGQVPGTRQVQEVGLGKLGDVGYPEA
jgi:hypothetical protein